MVQVIPMQRAPSMGQSLGAGFSQGMGQGLNFAIQDMMQQKQTERKSAYNKGVNKSIGEAIGDPKIGEMLGSTDPKESIGLVKLLMEQGALQKGLAGREAIYGFGGRQEDQTTRQGQQGFDQSLLENIPIEHRPAIEETEEAKPISRPSNFQQEEAQFRDLYGRETNPKIKAKLLEDWNKQRNFLQKQESIDYKKQRDTKSDNEKVSIPYISDIAAKEKKAAVSKGSFSTAENAVRSGKTEGLIPFLAQKFNWLPNQQPDAAILNAAKKEFLLSNITRTGSRPNMWLEQQVNSMFPMVGQSKTSALGVLEMLKADADIVEREAQIARQLEEQYKEQGLDYVPKTIEKEVNKQLIPYINERNKQLASDIQKVREEELTDKDLDRRVTKNVTKGTPLTDRMGLAILRATKGDTTKAGKIAKELGYKIPEEE